VSNVAKHCCAHLSSASQPSLLKKSFTCSMLSSFCEPASSPPPTSVNVRSICVTWPVLRRSRTGDCGTLPIAGSVGGRRLPEEVPVSLRLRRGDMDGGERLEPSTSGGRRRGGVEARIAPSAGGASISSPPLLVHEGSVEGPAAQVLSTISSQLTLHRPGDYRTDHRRYSTGSLVRVDTYSCTGTVPYRYRY
jgi:hypothetical protein